MSKRRIYTESDLREALGKIKANKLTTRHAAKVYNIPKVALQNYLKRGNDAFVKWGRKYITSSEDEAALERRLYSDMNVVKNTHACIHRIK